MKTSVTFCPLAGVGIEEAVPLIACVAFAIGAGTFASLFDVGNLKFICLSSMPDVEFEFPVVVELELVSVVFDVASGLAETLNHMGRIIPLTGL